MKYGVNLLLLNGTIGRRELEWFQKISDIGFDGVEIPVFEPAKIPVSKITSMAEKTGLKITASGALPAGSRLYGADLSRIKKAQKYLIESIRVVSDLGGNIFCGPLFKEVGYFDDSVSFAKQKRECTKNLLPVLDVTEECGVRLAFEPLNRFETDLINTTLQGIDFYRKCNSPSAGLLLDTFHMHIEEKDSAASIKSALDEGCLFHFHASENDRGVAGSGQVRWKEISKELKRQYNGWIVLESFSQKVRDIRKAVSCWRPFYDSPLEFMKEGLEFTKKMFG